MNNKKHYLSAILAFSIWGFFSIPLRALSNYQAGEILYFRILISALILLFIIFFFRKQELRSDISYLKSLSKSARRNVLLLTLSGGMLLCVNWLTFIYIVNSINIKTASFSYLICPVMTAILGYILIKESLTALQWIAVGLCTLSCIFMGLSSVSELGYSFLTAITYAVYLITQRKNQGFDRLNVLGIQVLFSLLILSLLFNFLVSSIPSTVDFYTLTTIIAVVFTVIPLFLNLYALNKINSATIGILMYINPLINFTIAFLIFKEKVDSVQMIGYITILVGLVLFNYPNLKKVRTSISGTNKL